MHNDDVADMIYAKDKEIRDLQDVILHFERRITDLQAEVKRLETEHYRGL
jgi:phage host-nuclease inhibitor protein Gam